jgi:hypothetical protein
MSLQTSFSQQGNHYEFKLTVQVPPPTVILPSISISLGTPEIVLPTLPPALAYLATWIAGLVATIQKLLEMIPDAKVTLIVKVGTTTIINQTFQTP